MTEVSLTEAARRLDVAPATLRRWVRAGLVPLRGGRWTPAAVAHARVVARLRERGHSLQEIRDATESGRLAHGGLERLLPGDGPRFTVAQAATAAGLDADLIRRLWTALGFPASGLETLSEDDLALLRSIAAVLDAGLPLAACLQLVRVYGHALAKIADAEVRLFHLYVHEPLIREGMPGTEIAETLDALAGELLPLAAPVLDQLHGRLLRHFVEQDVVGHLEGDADIDNGRLRVAIAFADLTGYTRLAEEAEEEAVTLVERFVASVEKSLPGDARVVKTIGDEVMVVGRDAAGLAAWAVGYQRHMEGRRPRPRIGLHAGAALYRDGDYYGRAVNLAARVAAHASGGEVVVTRPVADAAGRRVVLEPIGAVELKGIAEPAELFLAAEPADRAEAP